MKSGDEGCGKARYKSNLARGVTPLARSKREREIPYSKGTLRASGPPYTKKGGMAAN